MMEALSFRFRSPFMVRLVPAVSIPIPTGGDCSWPRPSLKFNILDGTVVVVPAAQIRLMGHLRLAEG